MTEEQAIERCHQLLETKHSNWLGLSNQQAIAILIDMLKEKDEKIEKDRELKHRLCKEVNQMFAEEEEKDKQIDLMADFMIGGLEDIAFKAICKKSNCVYELKDNRPTKCRKCKDCIKQYFKNKAKE